MKFESLEARRLLAAIEGFKWNDLNGNGVRDTDLITGSNPDVVFVVDVSDSTVDEFEGGDIGDINGDGDADTILDGELAGFLALTQDLIDRGLGASSEVAIVVFASSATSVDMDPSSSATLLATSPIADRDGNGVSDVEQILRSIQSGHLSTGSGTDFEDGLQTATDVLNSLGTAGSQGNVIFLSDGENGPNSYEDEVVALRSLGVNLRAFGAGTGASLPELQVIDFNAAIFTTTDELLNAFGGNSGGQVRFTEPGLAGWRIFLDTNSNGTYDAGEPYAITVANGNYSFTGLSAGTYRVAESDQSAWQQTFPIVNNGSHLVTLAAGSVVEDVNFGNWSPPVGSLPSAHACASDIAEPGVTTIAFPVAYSDDDGINLTTLGNNDLVVVGPDLTEYPVRIVNIDYEQHTDVTAFYEFDSPGGSLGLADEGVYSIQITAGQVRDTQGFAVPPGIAGAFQVKLGSPPSVNFLHQIGGMGLNPDRIHDTTVDGDGNVYITGEFSQLTDFDPGPGVFEIRTLNFSTDAFVGKYSPTGDLVWVKDFGGFGHERGVATAIDVDGNVYTAGTSSGEIYVSRLDTVGNLVWERNFGGNGDVVGGIAVDSLGNTYTTGHFSGSVDFDPGTGSHVLQSAGLTDAFLQKLDANGNFLWAHRFGSVNRDSAAAIAVDANNNVHLTGSFLLTVDFDPSADVVALASTPHGGTDTFIAKFDPAGTLTWAKRLGGTTDETGLAIAVDDGGNVYTTGYFGATGDFDPSDSAVFPLQASGLLDIFVSKLDNQGDFVWAVSMGGDGYDAGEGIAIGGDGNVFLTGTSSCRTDFDRSQATFQLGSGGLKDVFAAKLDTNGDFVWAQNLGGRGQEASGGIAVTESNSVFIGGSFSGEADLWPGAEFQYAVPARSSDMFLIRLDEPVNTPPTITAIADQTISMDGVTPALGITVSDAQTEATSLTLSGASSNTNLVPLSGIQFGGTGANRTVTVTPTPGNIGVATIEITVTDSGGLSTTTSFDVTVNDTARPMVVSTSPSDDALVNDGPAEFFVHFSEPMSQAPGSIIPSDLTLGGPGVGNAVVSAVEWVDSDTARFSISGAWGLGEVAVRLNGPFPKDLAGNDLTPYTTGDFVVDDAYEENDTLATAYYPGFNWEQTWLNTIDGLGLQADNDFYRIDVDSAASRRVVVDLQFTHADGDIDIALLDANGTELARSQTTTDNESIDVVVPDVGTYYLLVDFDNRGNTYNLWWDDVASNTPPTISDIPDPPAIDEDTSTGSIAFTVGDTETPAGNLTVTATSSNQTRVPDANIVVGGSGANRTVTITPNDHQFGDVTISVTVSDGELAATDTFVLTIIPVDDAPLISNIGDKTTEEETAIDISFIVLDPDGLTVPVFASAGSSNIDLVPNSNIVLSGSGAGRTATITPALDLFGTTTITITASDGVLASNKSFLLTVHPLNDPPTLTEITDPVPISAGAGEQSIGFQGVSAGGGESQPLRVEAFSNNLSLIPHPTVNYTSPTPSGTISYTPVANASGSAEIAVRVTDGGLDGNLATTDDNESVTRTFTVVVNAPGNAPTIDLSGASFSPTPREDSLTTIRSIAIADPDPGASMTFRIAVMHGRIEAVSGSGVTVTGSGTANLTMTGSLNSINSRLATSGFTYDPEDDFFGNETVTFTATDGTSPPLSGSADLSMNVAAVNDAPDFDLAGNRSVNEDSGTQTVTSFMTHISAGPPNESNQNLSLAVTNDDNSLFAVQPTIDLATGRLTFTPADNANGSATVTVTLSDNGGVANNGDDSTTESFVINVTPLNDDPTINIPGAKVIDENTPLTLSGANAIQVADVNVDETSDGELRVTLSVGHGRLTLAQTTGLSFSNGNGNSDVTMAFTGSAANVNAAFDGLQYSPNNGYVGNDAISVTVNDQGNTGSGGGNDVSAAVNVTVNAVGSGPFQHVFGVNGTALPGQSVSFDVYYDVSDDNKSLNGLSLLMFFDSSKLSYESLTNIFAKGHQGDPFIGDDLDNRDGAANTDKFVQVDWVDFSLDWPGETLPARLFTATFDTSATWQSGDSTHINFAAAVTATGYDFSFDPIAITAAQPYLDVNGDGLIQPLQDGILIVRYLLNQPDASLENPLLLPSGSTRTTAAELRAFLDAARAAGAFDGSSGKCVLFQISG